MKMIRNQFLVTLLLFIATTAFSQDSKSQAQKMTDKMKMDLTLTDSQALQVLPANQLFIESLEVLRSERSKLKKYRAFKTADEKRDKALKQILTDEQYRMFGKMKEENRDALRDARKNKG